MIYCSTRNKNLTVSPSEAVLNGIAPDGGLYIFDTKYDFKIDYKKLIGKSTFYMAEKIIGALLPDFSESEMHILTEKAYTGKFETDELTPLVKVGNSFVLELFRGPTSAFKDVALSMLPQLLTASAKKHGIKEKIMILTATSGDTGKAALSGFCDVDGTGIIVFYPETGVSAVQKAQMVTQEGNNVTVAAVRGNFDDAQTGVKNIFAALSDKKIDGVRFSSANSINIGRLAPQVVYYFKAYSDLVTEGEINDSDPVDFCVPTGNFGDILAGYIAKLMGLPVGKLICASNENNVLTDFFKTGVYDRNREFKKTASPSMDILISSNLERLLFLMSGSDTELVSKLMQELASTGKYKIPDEMKSMTDDAFSAGYCDDKTTKLTIHDVYAKFGYLLDTHTAVAWNVAEKYKKNNKDSKNPMVVLSTASPYKFPASVAEALGLDVGENEFDVMNELSERTGTSIPKGLCGLKERRVIHTDVCDKENMLEYVLSKAEIK